MRYCGAFTPRGFQNACPYAEFSSRNSSGVIELFSADNFMNTKISGFHAKIPWWSAGNTPVLFWKSENSFAVWSPGTRRDVQCKGDYVIIARVFVKK